MSNSKFGFRTRKGSIPGFLQNTQGFKPCAGISPISLTDLGAYYNFDNNVDDSSGNGLNGTATGSPTYSPGKYEEGLTLDGTSGQYVTVTDNAKLEGSGGNISICAWLNMVDGGHLVFKISSGTGYRIYPRPGLDYLVTIGDANISRGNPSTGTLIHFAFTYNNNIAKLYENGAQIGSDATIGAKTLSNALDLTIGYTSGAGINGTIDELNIWQRVLSATEILDLYNSTCPLKTT